jgi:hypothetical protein
MDFFAAGVMHLPPALRGERVAALAVLQVFPERFQTPARFLRRDDIPSECYFLAGRLSPRDQIGADPA